MVDEVQWEEVEKKRIGPGQGGIKLTSTHKGRQGCESRGGGDMAGRWGGLPRPHPGQQGSRVTVRQDGGDASVPAMVLSSLYEWNSG